MADRFGFGWAEAADDGDPIAATEPEIVRTMAVGGLVVRADRGAVYIEAHERLPGEVRVVARCSMTQELARELVAKVVAILPKGRH